MANWNDPQSRQGFGASPSLDGRADGRASYDMGLRRHMLSIYNYMASGVLLSGIVAMLFANSGMAMQMIASPVRWLVMLAPLGFVFAISGGANRFQESTLKMLYWGFCVVMGLSLSTIFLVFTASSIATTFFATAAAFAGLSLYGYTTKRSLSAMGSFMLIGLFGLILGFIVNIFLGSTTLDLALSAIGVLVFAGLTAWDTQKIKLMYMAGDSSEVREKKSIYGALTLYLDFINMFIMLLHLFGNRE